MTTNVSETSADALTADLHSIAERIRREPHLARDLDVSSLAHDVALRWRETADMLQASEAVPVAAWIVRKKVEGLIRPDEPDDEAPPFDVTLRPLWITDAVEELVSLQDLASGYYTRVAPPVERTPSAIKDPSLWKLAWSYPVLRVKKDPPPRVVAKESEPLHERMQVMLARLSDTSGFFFQEDVRGLGRAEWVAHFLAAVHLWHERHIEIEQTQAFGPLWLTSCQARGGMKD